jgi:hypothetical protein
MEGSAYRIVSESEQSPLTSRCKKMITVLMASTVPSYTERKRAKMRETVFLSHIDFPTSDYGVKLT